MKRIIRSALLLLFLVIARSHADVANKPTPLSQREQTELNNLSEKNFRSENKSESEAIKQAQQELKKLLEKRKLQHQLLEAQKIPDLEKQIENLKNTRQRLVQIRNSYYRNIVSLQERFLKFERDIFQLINERPYVKGDFPLGIPVFARSKIWKPDRKSRRTLYVVRSHPSQQQSRAISGEVICQGMGKIQFVVIKKRGRGFMCYPAGEEFTVTKEDYDQRGRVYRKRCLFNLNFCSLRQGDFWGLVADNSIELTYDDQGTGSTSILPMEEGEIPEDGKQIALPAQNDMVALGKERSDWRFLVEPQNKGKLFSFVMMVRPSHEEEEDEEEE